MNIKSEVMLNVKEAGLNSMQQTEYVNKFISIANKIKPDVDKCMKSCKISNVPNSALCRINLWHELSQSIKTKYNDTYFNGSNAELCSIKLVENDILDLIKSFKNNDLFKSIKSDFDINIRKRNFQKGNFKAIDIDIICKEK